MAVEPSSSHAAVCEASLAASNDRACDRLMQWLALYVPTYGMSVVFHAAVGLLLAFLVTWPGGTSDRLRPVKGGIVPMRPPVKTEKRASRDQHKSRGKLRVQPPSLVRRPTQKLEPDVATNHLQRLHVIGVGSGADVLGGLKGLDTTDRIFAHRDRGPEGGPFSKVVYLVDRSGSMSDSILFVKAELRRSILELDASAEFHVMFYSSGPPVEMPTRRLVRASDRNKRLAFDFIDRVIAGGETDPSKALERAFAVQPQLIYLLTDGEFDRGVIDLARRLNVGRRTRVCTIGFLYTYPGTPAAGVLKQIAHDSGGEYRFVSERDLESIAAGL